MQNTARRRLLPVPGHLSRKEECQTDFPRDNPQTSSYPLRAAWPPDIGFIPTSVLPVLLLQDLEPDGEADDQPLDDELVERGDAEQTDTPQGEPSLRCRRAHKAAGRSGYGRERKSQELLSSTKSPGQCRGFRLCRDQSFAITSRRRTCSSRQP